MEKKIRHLEMIQRVIDRMAGNLFFLKGWAISLVAALFALAAKDSDQTYIYITYIPLIIFWIMDGYFLSQERLYRALYEHVRNIDEPDIDFSMNTKMFVDKCRNKWISSIFSHTLILFYVPLIVMTQVILYLIRK